MSEAATIGSRDAKGDWRPADRLSAPPIYNWPPRPSPMLRWLFGVPGYLFPWNALYAAIATLTWLLLTPGVARLKTLAPDWIGLVLLRNLALVLAVYGAWHFRLYIQRRQGTEYKYNPRWPSADSDAFLFRNQVLDNVFWTVASGVPIWTAYEVLTLWAQANGWLPYASWTAHPVYCALLMLFIPIFREVHFYLIHRLIHWPPLYRTVHSLHNKNVNPGPWSGLAMHPVEHLLYFSGVLLHWIVPSNGLHVIFHLQHLALAPAKGHAGFAKVVLGNETSIATHDYMHYLHHKHFEVNYGNELVPVDQWFGTFHDGTEAGEQAMKARLRARPQRKASA